MIFLKTLRSNPRISHPLQRFISSDASSSNPKPTTLSSLFAKKPFKNSQTTRPSTDEKSPLSSLFATNPSNLSSRKKHSTDGKLPRKDFAANSNLSTRKKPTTNGKLPNKYFATNSSDLSNRKTSSTNGKLHGKDKKVMFLEKEFAKELSPEATMIVSRLIENGYLKDANFWTGEQLEPHQIPANLYTRHFLKAAAEKFGRDHQEVAKWLSGSDLKKVALFGCPSVERNSVFAAKRLRAFFRIQEDVVCRGCKLRTSCRFINKKVGTMDKVVLEDVMRLITVYTLDSVPPQLVIPDELRCSIGKLVKEAVSLTN